jgi:MobA-like NTP transferase domain
MPAATLVLLAAGVSSRFGRPKVLEPLGEAGETLPEYAIVDALRAGFGSVVLVTRPELAMRIAARIERTLGEDLPISWALQTLEPLPGDRHPPAGRTRPWGTGHALLAAAPYVTGALAVANADDWYGPEAYRALCAALSQRPGRGALVAYRMGDTLSPHGGVSRGWVKHEGPRVIGVLELLGAAVDPTHTTLVRGTDPSGGEHAVPASAWASMNLWGLPAAALASLSDDFAAFIERVDRLPDAEFALSTALDALIRRGALEVDLLPEGRRWLGLTFAADVELARARLQALHADGTYPVRLADALPRRPAEHHPET